MNIQKNAWEVSLQHKPEESKVQEFLVGEFGTRYQDVVSHSNIMQMDLVTGGVTPLDKRFFEEFAEDLYAMSLDQKSLLYITKLGFSGDFNNSPCDKQLVILFGKIAKFINNEVQNGENTEFDIRNLETLLDISIKLIPAHLYQFAQSRTYKTDLFAQLFQQYITIDDVPFIDIPEEIWNHMETSMINALTRTKLYRINKTLIKHVNSRKLLKRTDIETEPTLQMDIPSNQGFCYTTGEEPFLYPQLAVIEPTEIRNPSGQRIPINTQKYYGDHTNLDNFIIEQRERLGITSVNMDWLTLISKANARKDAQNLLVNLDTSLLYRQTNNNPQLVSDSLYGLVNFLHQPNVVEIIGNSTETRFLEIQQGIYGSRILIAIEPQPRAEEDAEISFTFKVNVIQNTDLYPDYEERLDKIVLHRSASDYISC